MLLSIVIPVYNSEATLERVLVPVLSQTTKDIEVICIDDASTDGTWGKLLSFAALSDRIRVYQNGSNLGVSATRNRGISLSA